MSITATCGCILTEEERLGTAIAVKDYCRDGSRAISYPSVCDKCLKWYEKSKLILKTKKQEEKWLFKIKVKR